MKTIVRKKNETVKEELLNSLRVNDTKEREFNITSITNPRKAINVIDHYKEIMKTQNKKTIGYVATQGQILK